MGWKRKRSPSVPEVQELQSAFMHVGLTDCGRTLELLEDAIDQQLWRACKRKDGSDFESFPQWAAHPQPEGLGVDNQRSAEFLRTLLFDMGRVATWALVLEYIRVKQGRRANIALDDDFRPFYRISRASNAIDQRLCRLQTKAPDVAQKFRNGDINFDEALKIAGISRKHTSVVQRLRSMLEEFKQLGDEGQVQVLEMLWTHTEPRARTDFLASARS